MKTPLSTVRYSFASKLVLQLTGLLIATAIAPVTFAAWPPVASLPLLGTNGTTAPNLVITLDNSGSMAWAFVPDAIGYISGGTGTAADSRRIHSSDFNSLAYNPATTYAIPRNATDTGPAGVVSFSAAPVNGFNGALGTINLGSEYRPTNEQRPLLTRAQIIAGGVGNRAIFFQHPSDFAQRSTGTLAYYYVFTPSGTCAVGTVTEACYTRRDVTSSSGPSGSDERQNFAIWYSFYRTRLLSIISSMTTAVYEIPATYRVAYQDFDTCMLPNSSITQGSRNSCPVPSGSSSKPNLIAVYTAARRTQLLTWLHSADADAAVGTPLRSTLQRVGEYFKTAATDIAGPAAYNIGVSATPLIGCRRNYHLMFTDGVWNGDAATAVNNVDGTSLTLPDGTTYAPQAPYIDTNSNSLADIAFKYWAEDLQPGTSGVTNAVKPIYNDTTGSLVAQYWNPRNNPATWQHMVNFPVGLGLSKTLNGVDPQPTWGGSTYDGDYPLLAAGTKAWPATATDAPGNVADLWHAALNSRGEFFAADTPTQLVQAFRRVLAIVAAEDGNGGQIGASGTRQTTGTKLYTTAYKTSPWSGKLDASNTNPDGSASTLAWSTNSTLINQTGRNIYTANAPLTSTTSVGGRAWAWGGFTAAEKTAFFSDSQNIFNYIAGDRTQESAGTNALRKRDVGVLGEVVASDILVAGKTDYGYGSAGLSCLNYSTYVQSKREVVFVGSGAGMLHAFNGSTGAEIFAYVPYGVLDRIKKTSDKSYVREPLVESSLAAHDYCDGTTWKTALVGTLGAGGRSVFGLDITSVITGSSPSFSASNVMWEINDLRLGKGIPTPAIGRAKENGVWQAYLGNGYGSNDDRGYLFVVNLITGSSAVTALTGARTGLNGLSSPTALEFNRAKVTAIYAGDYQGSLWKFTQNTSGTWRQVGVAPYFVTKTDNSQPITGSIAVTPHPTGGVQLLFGTGKFFEQSDADSKIQQSLYGLRDRNASLGSRSDLVQQTLTSGTLYGTDVRTVSSNDVPYATGAGQKNGWYIDLPVGSATNQTAERMIVPPIVDGTGALFLTIDPTSDVSSCSASGKNFATELNAFTGTVRGVGTFDLNSDGNADSVGTVPVPVVSVQLEGAASIKPAIVQSVAANWSQTSRPRAGAGSSTTGSAGQPPTCDSPGVNCRCSAGLYLSGGVCKKLACLEGSTVVRTATSAVCRVTVFPQTWIQQVR
jgi:type IV pilus assembly protein PilY1